MPWVEPRSVNLGTVAASWCFAGVSIYGRTLKFDPIISQKPQACRQSAFNDYTDAGFGSSPFADAPPSHQVNVTCINAACKN